MGLTARVLAVDAGNSKTDVAVVAADGKRPRHGPRRRVPAAGGGRRHGGGRPRRRGRPRLRRRRGERRSTMSRPVSPTPTSPWRRSSWRPRCTRARGARAWRSATTPSPSCAPGITEPRGVAVVCGAGHQLRRHAPRRPYRPLPRAGPDLRRLGRRLGPGGGGAVARGPRGGRPRRPTALARVAARATSACDIHVRPHRGAAPRRRRARPPPRADAGALRHGRGRRPGRPRDRRPAGRRGGGDGDGGADPPRPARRGDAGPARRRRPGRPASPTGRRDQGSCWPTRRPEGGAPGGDGEPGARRRAARLDQGRWTGCHAGQGVLRA